MFSCTQAAWKPAAALALLTLSTAALADKSARLPATAEGRTQAFVQRSPGLKVADIALIPFISDGKGVFDLTEFHLTAEPMSTGVFVKFRVTGRPHKGHSSSQETPVRVSLKSGGKVVAQLNPPLDWSETCFRTDVFAAQILVPQVRLEDLDAVEIAPLSAIAHPCH